MRVLTSRFPSGALGDPGAWRSLVSALDWGSRGRRFKSSRPDSIAALREQALPGLLSLPGRASPYGPCCDAQNRSLRSLSSRREDVMPPRYRSPSLRYAVSPPSGVKSSRFHTIAPLRHQALPGLLSLPGRASPYGPCCDAQNRSLRSLSSRREDVMPPRYRSPSLRYAVSPPSGVKSSHFRPAARRHKHHQPHTVHGEGSSGPAATWPHITTNGPSGAVHDLQKPPSLHANRSSCSNVRSVGGCDPPLHASHRPPPTTPFAGAVMRPNAGPHAPPTSRYNAPCLI